MRALQKILGGVTSGASHGRAFSEVTPCEDLPRRSGRCSQRHTCPASDGNARCLPTQTADGVMFFQLDDYTLTVAQILELLDKNRLDREGIRSLAEAQKK